MGLETITKKIDGLKFYINQFPARKCKKLELRTAKILAPLMNILDDVKGLDSEVNMNLIIKSIKEILVNVNEDVFDDYMMDMVEFTSIELQNKEGKGVEILQLKDESNFDAVFIGKSITIYKLLIEIMKANKMFFFELLGGGGLNLTGLLSQTKIGKASHVTK